MPGLGYSVENEENARSHEPITRTKVITFESNKIVEGMLNKDLKNYGSILSNLIFIKKYGVFS